MAWKKGQSGNPLGRTGEKLFADAVRLAVNETDPVNGKRKLRAIAEKLVEQAVSGEAWAIQQVADRLDGKPAQESTVTVERRISELSDQDIAARIAELRGAGASDGDDASPVDPAKLN